MNIQIDVNTAKFAQTLERVVAAGKKTFADDMNRRVAQVLIGAKGFKGAVHFTRKATKGRIKRDLRKKYPARQARGGTKPVPLMIIKASQTLKQKGISKGLGAAGWRAAVSRASQRLEKRRDASRAFLAAGWIKCAGDLGVKIKTRLSKQLFANGRASKSVAFRATMRNLEVRAYNSAADEGTTAGAIIHEGLNAGIAEQIRDMELYLQRKAEKAMSKTASAA